MDHLSTVLDGNLDNLIAGQVCPDGGILTTLANYIGFVGLWSNVSTRRMGAGTEAGTMFAYFAGAC